MKKQNKEQLLKVNKSEESTEYKKLVTIIIIILLVFIAIYLLTTLLTKKEKVDIFKNDLNSSEVQYDEIIIGSMFNIDGEYYVLLLEEDDPYKSLFENYVSTIKEKDKKIYTVDLTSAFNKKYISEENNYEEDDFKVSKTTLLKINNKKIKEHYEDKDEICDKLEELTK